LKTDTGNGHVWSVDKHKTEAFLEEEGEQEGDNHCNNHDDNNAEEYNKYNTTSA
jgi:hypothetical protein